MAKCSHYKIISYGALNSLQESFDTQVIIDENQNGEKKFVSCPKADIKLEENVETKKSVTLSLELQKSINENLLQNPETKSTETLKKKALNQSKNKNVKYKWITHIIGDKSCANDASDISDLFEKNKNKVATGQRTRRKNAESLDEIPLFLEQVSLKTSVACLKSIFLQAKTDFNFQIDRDSLLDCFFELFNNNVQIENNRYNPFQSNTNNENSYTRVVASNQALIPWSLFLSKENNVFTPLYYGSLVLVDELNQIVSETCEITGNNSEALLTKRKNENLAKSTENQTKKIFLRLDFDCAELPKFFERTAEDSLEKMASDVDAAVSFQTETKDVELSDCETSRTLMEISGSQARLRRSSSLKTNNATSGTSGSKKIVRFADSLGLDLANVRIFLDEVPNVPSSAYKYLNFGSPKSETFYSSLTLVPMFQQPGHQMNFMEKLQTQTVCLETVSVMNSSALSVSGTVRVLNLNYHKSVHVRYSVNNWKTFSDLQATYVPGSCDGPTDKFSFVVYGHNLKAGDKIELAFRYSCDGNQYWDNNAGINYSFNCLPETSANGFFSRGKIIL